MAHKLLLLPGDGIGVEVMGEVERLIEWLNAEGHAEFTIDRGLVGGSAYDKHGKAISEDDMQKARVGLEALRTRAARVAVPGHREFHPGWHTALDLANLLTISEAIARSALERRESRGGHFRDDYPVKDPAYAHFNTVVKRGENGQMEVTRVPLPEMRDDLKQIIEEEK